MGCSSSVPVQAEPQAHRRNIRPNDVVQVPSQGLGPVQKSEKQEQQQENNSQVDIDTGKKKTSTQEQPIQDNDDGKLFEDVDFPATVETITTDLSHEKYQLFKDAIWRRPPEIMNCNYDEIKVFDSIDVNDIAQGILGNCYFLASLSGLAEEPQRVKPIIQKSEINKNGKYGVRFYVRGVPTVITVDDRFPCFNYSPYEPLFSKPKGKELWAILIEKAWAKLFKSYSNIEAGTVEEALGHLTGAPSFSFKTDKHSDEEIWTRIKQADLKKYIIGASSRGDVQRSTGIVGNHAYTVVSVHEVQGYKLLKLRNPWGNFEWKGDFSDSSPLWTESLKKAVGYEDSDNGMFFMSLKDFRNYYEDYSIHHYYDGWHYCCLEQKSGPKHANYYKFSVDKPCEAYFRIHQKDPRFLSETERESYKPSAASFMIVKVEKDGRYKLVLDSDIETDAHLTHGGTTIFMTKDGKVEIKEAGDYIIRAKVLWRHGKEDTCTISAYSSTKIDMKPISSVKDFQTKYLTLLAEKNQEENPLISNSVSVVGSYEGYVYAMVKNREEKQLTCSIELTQLDNLKLAKPSKVSETKFTLNLAPGSSQLVFLKVVDRSQGCAYEWSWECDL